MVKALLRRRGACACASPSPPRRPAPPEGALRRRQPGRRLRGPAPQRQRRTAHQRLSDGGAHAQACACGAAAAHGRARARAVPLHGGACAGRALGTHAHPLGGWSCTWTSCEPAESAASPGAGGKRPHARVAALGTFSRTRARLPPPEVYAVAGMRAQAAQACRAAARAPSSCAQQRRRRATGTHLQGAAPRPTSARRGGGARRTPRCRRALPAGTGTGDAAAAWRARMRRAKAGGGERCGEDRRGAVDRLATCASSLQHQRFAACLVLP
jgi:hypothetical protein